MPIIIDTNCFANVFERNSKNHPDFKPVLDWIVSGKGMMAFGGSKYLGELKKAKKYLRIIRLLKDQKKVLVGNQYEIDILQEKISLNFPDPDFDDPHLPAIAIITKCILICSEDMRSVRFVKNSSIYPNGFQTPSYYSSKKNLDLLCDKYVHEANKPLLKIPKTLQDVLNKNITEKLNRKKR